jgi:NADH-quinone oxidoreductase subunit M
MASIGLPGLGDFVGEFLVLLGTYKVSILLTSLAGLGIVASALYGLRLVRTVFYGPNANRWQFPDLYIREWLIVAPMLACLLWIGLYPQPFLNTFRPVVDAVQQPTTPPLAARR